MAAQVLRWWTPAQLETASARVAAVFDAWTTAWGIDGRVVVQCAVAAPPAATASSWQPLGAGVADAGQLWVAGVADVRLLAAALLGMGSEPAPLALEISGHARSDLLLRLGGLAAASALSPAPAYAAPIPPAAQLRAWSGAVTARCTGPADNIELHLGPLAAAALMPAAAPAVAVARPPLVPLTRALDSRKLVLRVQLSAIELDVGAMQALAPGDVLVLPHLLSEPLIAQVDGSPMRCAAFLGARGGRRAVELLALNSSIS